MLGGGAGNEEDVEGGGVEDGWCDDGGWALKLALPIGTALVGPEILAVRTEPCVGSRIDRSGDGALGS